jgi:hypothetical protein
VLKSRPLLWDRIVMLVYQILSRISRNSSMSLSRPRHVLEPLEVTPGTVWILK